MFFSFLCLFEIVFPNNYTKNGRQKGVLIMYIDLIKRWDVQAFGTDEERQRQKREKVQYVEEIRKGQVKPYTQLELVREFFLIGASSFIHSFFPEILPDHAAKGLIRIYLNTQLTKDTSWKATKK